MDIHSFSLKDIYGFASGWFGRTQRAEHFDMVSIFGTAPRELPAELEVQALLDPYNLGSATDNVLGRWSQLEFSAPEVRTPLGFLGAVSSGIATLRSAEASAQDPADAAALRQAMRELSAYEANAQVGWEGANALQAG